ncbi:MAG: alpha/beta hydrolase, partial [Planctomycetia bacterium]|nr:alpha/beta hydrolase [Planctomycetia bacterium]
PSDRVSCRPDFALLIYPAYLVGRPPDHSLAPELKVNGRTPRTFLVQTQDDGVRVECSLFYYLALKEAKVPSELHLYPDGGHGYGLRPSPHEVSHWPERAHAWLRSIGVLERKTP